MASEKSFSDHAVSKKKRNKIRIDFARSPIDNNAPRERAQKGDPPSKERHVLYKTRIGARLGDLFMSIFYTYQLNKINPLHYMNIGLRTPCRDGGQPKARAPLDLPAGCLGDLPGVGPTSGLSGLGDAVPQWRPALR